MLAFIQAGGAGTRLKEITGDLPKPMVPICGKPILLHQVESLIRSDVKDIVMVVSASSTVVQDFFGDGSKFGAKISYIVENQPLGTAGALYYLAKQRDEDFFLVMGDLMLDVDWQRFYAFHKKHRSFLTAFAHPNSHPYDSDLLVSSKEGKLLRVLSKKEPRDDYYNNLTNAGLYVVSKEILETFQGMDEPIKMDFEKDLVAPSIGAVPVYCYRSTEYVKDCGTPDRYYSVSRDLEKGVVASKNLSHPQKCIFLDRDGTINKFGNFVTKAEMLELLPWAGKAIAKINTSGYLAIVVTNQPVIARGETDFAELSQIHMKMETLLGQEGAYIDDLFYCPHHPDKGFPGERPEYKIVCECRKPKIGMLLEAKNKYNIDFAASWMIGDTCQDVQTGINAGCKTILLTGGDPHPYAKYGDAKPDYVCENLEQAVNYILSQEGE